MAKYDFLNSIPSWKNLCLILLDKKGGKILPFFKGEKNVFCFDRFLYKVVRKILIAPKLL
jgi:hypothetical protein